VQELLERLAAPDVRELNVRRGAIRVRVSKDGTVAAAVGPVSPQPAAGSGAPAVGAAEPAAAVPDAIVAPLTGVFYRSPSPQAPPFVQIGSVVAAGDIIGLIEAMKLFNEIRSTKSGIVRRLVADSGQLVRARQPLIELDPA
jgi:acetyl-CoA carboxylase biotin carboxyl carrier protein